MNMNTLAHFTPTTFEPPNSPQRPQASLTVSVPGRTPLMGLVMVTRSEDVPSKLVRDLDVPKNYFTLQGKVNGQSLATRLKHRVEITGGTAVLRPLPRVLQLRTSFVEKDSGDFRYRSLVHTTVRSGDVLVRCVSAGARLYLAESKQHSCLQVVAGEVYEVSVEGGSVESLSWSLRQTRTIVKRQNGGLVTREIERMREMYRVQGSTDVASSLRAAQRRALVNADHDTEGETTDDEEEVVHPTLRKRKHIAQGESDEAETMQSSQQRPRLGLSELELEGVEDVIMSDSIPEGNPMSMTLLSFGSPVPQVGALPLWSGPTQMLGEGPFARFPGSPPANRE